MTFHQLTLNPRESVDDRLDRDFAEFHSENPHVFVALVRLAREGRRQGLTRIGIGMLFEVLRWDYRLRTRGDEFKLNNNLRSRYARAIMDQEPDLAGMFEIRELRAL